MLWILYIAIDVLVNWFIIEKRKSVPNYIQLTLVRGIAAIVVGAIWDVQTDAEALNWFLFTAITFWLLFDLGINLARKKPLFYRGENSKIDRFGNNYPKVYFSLKAIALLTLVFYVRI